MLHFTNRPCGSLEGQTTANFAEVDCPACRQIEATFGDEAEGPAPLDAEGIPAWAENPKLFAWIMVGLVVVIIALVAAARLHLF